MEQWDGLVYYFQKFIPTKKDKLMESSSFKRISNFIRKQTIKSEIHFIMSSAELFMSFTEIFQKDEPLIHVLYLKLEELVEKLARRVCKEVSGKEFSQLFEEQNKLAMKEIIVSKEVKEGLENLSEKTVLLFMRDARDHYIAGCNYLIDKALKLSTVQIIEIFVSFTNKKHIQLSRHSKCSKTASYQYKGRQTP